MEAILGIVIGIAIAAIVSGVVIWIVSALNLGIKVTGIGWAMLAGIIIGALTNLALGFIPDFGGLWGALVHIIVAGAVIYGIGPLLKGFSVDGFMGALLASVAMSFINLGILWLMGGVSTV